MDDVPADMVRESVSPVSSAEESGVVARFEEAADRAERREARAAQAGDAESVERLWQRHRRWVAAILLAYKPRWADVDDLLQEVAVAVVRKVHELRDPAAVRPWLRTVAINAAHAAGRSGQRRGRETSLDESGAPSARSTLGATVGSTDDAKRLMDLAATLPEGYREPLLLKAVQGLSYREIGRILGLPETTIETRIARGRRQLRDLAASQGIGPDS